MPRTVGSAWPRAIPWLLADVPKETRQSKQTLQSAGANVNEYSKDRAARAPIP